MAKEQVISGLMVIALGLVLTMLIKYGQTKTLECFSDLLINPLNFRLRIIATIVGLLSAWAISSFFGWKFSFS